MERKLIVHKVHGLCEVIDTVELNESLYYKIKALNEDSLILYCPIDKKNDLYRPLLTKEEIYDVLNYMKSINDVEFDFSKQRRTRFKELLYSGNIKNIAYLTRVLYLYKEYKGDKNQALGLEDTRMFDTAKRMLIDETSVVFNLTKEESDKFIHDYLYEVDN